MLSQQTFAKLAIAMKKTDLIYFSLWPTVVKQLMECRKECK